MTYRLTDRGRLRRQARQQRFLCAARDLFGECGYQATTVPAIVAAAQSSIGAFYLYFKNKEDVFIAVLRSVEEELSAVLNEAQSSFPDDVVSQMRASVEALVEFLSAHAGDARILLLDAPALAGEIHSAWRQMIESHTRSVARALNSISHRLSIQDINTAAACWVGAVNEAVLRWLEKSPSERVVPSALAHAVADFNLAAVGANLDQR